MKMMVLDGYLLEKYFLALQNACVQFSGVTTVVISQNVIWKKHNKFFHISNSNAQIKTISTRPCHFGKYGSSDGNVSVANNIYSVRSFQQKVKLSIYK